MPEDKKKAAAVLGWDKKLWDDDGKADTEDLGWHDLTHDQRKAAESFGYHPKLWDEGHGHYHLHDHPHHAPKHEDHASPKKDDEKKDNSGDAGVDVSNLNVNDDKKDDEKKKPNFKQSKAFGGNGGDAFDHGNNRHISEIIMYADNHVVRGLEIKYANATLKAGNCDKSLTIKKHEFNVHADKGEFITSVTVRSNKFVQSLAFKTNKGRLLGPCGGKGWSKMNLTGDDTEGEEVKVPAPMKLQLCGLSGRAGSCIDQIVFRWGPVPQGKK